MVKISRNVTIDVDVYTSARVAGINLSEAAENGLRSALERLGHSKKTPDELFEEKKRILLEKDGKERARKLRKFTGLPSHVVQNAKKSAISGRYDPDTIAGSLSKYNAGITAEDVEALVPRFSA